MGSAVFHQVALPGEGFETDVASERLDATVELEVRLPVLLPGETFGADRAGVRPISRVGPHVDVKVPAECKLLAATRFRTGEPTALSVDPDVALQVRQAREGLVASVAPELIASG